MLQPNCFSFASSFGLVMFRQVSSLDEQMRRERLMNDSTWATGWWSRVVVHCFKKTSNKKVSDWDNQNAVGSCQLAHSESCCLFVCFFFEFQLLKLPILVSLCQVCRLPAGKTEKKSGEELNPSVSTSVFVTVRSCINTCRRLGIFLKLERVSDSGFCSETWAVSLQSFVRKRTVWNFWLTFSGGFRSPKPKRLKEPFIQQFDAQRVSESQRVRIWSLWVYQACNPKPVVRNSKCGDIFVRQWQVVSNLRPLAKYPTSSNSRSSVTITYK